MTAETRTFNSIEEIEREFFPALFKARRIIADRHPEEVREVAEELQRETTDPEESR